MSYIIMGKTKPFIKLLLQIITINNYIQDFLDVRTLGRYDICQLATLIGPMVVGKTLIVICLQSLVAIEKT